MRMPRDLYPGIWYSKLQVAHRSIQGTGNVSTNMAAIPPTITGSQQITQPLHLITSSAVVFAKRIAMLATRVSPSPVNQP